METKIIDGFWSKCNDIRAKWMVTHGVNEVEDSLLDLLIYVKKHPEYNDQFKKCFREIVLNPNLGTLEILIFCMRELRWKEVQELIVLSIKETDDPRIRDALGDILDVYDDKWKNSDLYDYYKDQH